MGGSEETLHSRQCNLPGTIVVKVNSPSPFIGDFVVAEQTHIPHIFHFE